jgi:transcriptional regulator of NAD metabolism
LDKLKGEERRNRIIEKLSRSKTPISGSQLAGEFGVSRQVIVTDIALLREKNPQLMSTSSGYIMLQEDANHRIFKVSHSDEETRDELMGIVDLGGTVIDIFVEHKAYGTIRAPLNISSKRDVENFIEDIRSGASSLLKNVTEGYHYHTVGARSAEILDEIEEMLRRRGYLIEVAEAATIYEPKRYNRI